MIKILDCNKKNYIFKINDLLRKRTSKHNNAKRVVLKIIVDVKKNGDKALIKYERKYNNNSEIIVSKNKISKSIKSLDYKVRKAIDFAYNRIYKFHSKQKFNNIFY